VRIIKIVIYNLRISLKEFRETQQWLKLIQRVPLIKKPELLDDILEETEELVKVFVTNIKTAEKKPRLGVVGRSSFKITQYSINATCDRLENNLALIGLMGGVGYRVSGLRFSPE